MINLEPPTITCYIVWNDRLLAKVCSLLCTFHIVNYWCSGESEIHKETYHLSDPTHTIVCSYGILDCPCCVECDMNINLQPWFHVNSAYVSRLISLPCSCNVEGEMNTGTYSYSITLQSSIHFCVHFTFFHCLYWVECVLNTDTYSCDLSPVLHVYISVVISQFALLL